MLFLTSVFMSSHHVPIRVSIKTGVFRVFPLFFSHLSLVSPDFPSQTTTFQAFAPPPGLEFLPPGLFEEERAPLEKMGG